MSLPRALVGDDFLEGLGDEGDQFVLRYRPHLFEPPE